MPGSQPRRCAHRLLSGRILHHRAGLTEVVKGPMPTQKHGRRGQKALCKAGTMSTATVLLAAHTGGDAAKPRDFLTASGAAGVGMNSS